MFDISNRRYTGCKIKLMPKIENIVKKYCQEHKVLFDVFGGTGVVSSYLSNYFDRVVINDFLYSNEIIYKAFFENRNYNINKIEKIVNKYKLINAQKLKDNYVSINYGNKYFNIQDAKLIGYIRGDIQELFEAKEINEKEYDILLASLLYSFDKCANTVGHYEAYIKTKEVKSGFVFDLIKPIKNKTKFCIYRKDSNELVKHIAADVAFVDPPYNSRQYSRFYHVMETIIKWEKPKLFGVAMKPLEENMSNYCRNSAPKVFEDLIQNLNAKYIIVTYNNTYDSKSSSSRNKIALEEIKTILNSKGKTKIFEENFHRFNAGKTEKTDHKEFIFLTKVDTKND